jgi:hypothetical protein
MKQDQRIDLAADKIALNKDNIVRTIADIMPILAVKEYNQDTYAQYVFDRPRTKIWFERGLSMLPISRIYYEFIVRPYRQGISIEEAKENPWSHKCYAISVDDFAQAYCDIYELDNGYLPEILKMINKTLEQMKSGKVES